MEWFTTVKNNQFNIQSPSGFWAKVADSINPSNPTIHYTLINDHLQNKTFLQGHQLTIEDLYLASKLMLCPAWCKVLPCKTRPFHLTRWFMHIISTFPNIDYKIHEKAKKIIKKDHRLVTAIKQENMDLFINLLDKVDINAQSPSDGGLRPLHVAALKGNLQVIEILLQKGADIEGQDEDGLTPIIYSAQSRSVTVLNFFIEKKANIFHMDKQQRNIFYWAASLGNVQMLQVLLQKAMDPNTKTLLGRTPLSKSAWNGNVEVLSFLLEIPGINLEIPDRHGRTALHNAVWGSVAGREGRKIGENTADSPECAKLLIEKGCNIEALDKVQNTPLCIACCTYSPKSVKLLLSYGANVYHRNIKGYYPFHQALFKGHYECAEIIADFGFDINICNDNLTPIQSCMKHTRIGSLNWLVSRGVYPKKNDIELSVQWVNSKILEFFKNYMEFDGLEDLIIKKAPVEGGFWIVENTKVNEKMVIEAIRKDKKLGKAALDKWSGLITIKILETMVEAKIDTNEYLHRAEPNSQILRLAIKQKNIKLALKLIQDYPELITDSDEYSGNTALHISCSIGQTDLVSKLINIVQNPFNYIIQPNKKGMTSISLAQLHKHYYIAEMLKDIVIQSQGSINLSQVQNLTYEETDETLTAHPYTEKTIPLGYWKSQRESKPLNDTKYVYIDTDLGIEDLINEIENFSVIGVDLEYHAFESNKGCICLLQISDGEVDYVIDGLVCREKLRILVKRFMDDEKIIKVFHGCDSDLMWLKNDFDAHPVRVFDTARAYKVLNNEKQLPSLAKLVQGYFDVIMDKSFQIAEWRIRPLPSAMIEYARIDAHFLLSIFNKLLMEMNETQLQIVNSQCNHMCLKPSKNKLIRVKVSKE